MTKGQDFERAGDSRIEGRTSSRRDTKDQCMIMHADVLRTVRERTRRTARTLVRLASTEGVALGAASLEKTGTLLGVTFLETHCEVCVDRVEVREGVLLMVAGRIRRRERNGYIEAWVGGGGPRLNFCWGGCDLESARVGGSFRAVWGGLQMGVDSDEDRALQACARCPSRSAR